MAENNWVLQDGRSILVEFDAAATSQSWLLQDGRSVDVAFTAPASAWADHAWLRGGQMVQAAEVGGASINGTASITLEDTAISSAASLSINSASALTLEDAITVSSATLTLDGSASVPLEDVICAATGSLSINAIVSIQLEDVQASADATIGEAINAAADILLEDTVCVAAGNQDGLLSPASRYVARYIGRGRGRSFKRSAPSFPVEQIHLDQPEIEQAKVVYTPVNIMDGLSLIPSRGGNIVQLNDAQVQKLRQARQNLAEAERKASEAIQSAMNAEEEFAIVMLMAA